MRTTHNLVDGLASAEKSGVLELICNRGHDRYNRYDDQGRALVCPAESCSTLGGNPSVSVGTRRHPRRLLFLVSLLALGALAIALAHSACADDVKAGSDCPLCMLVRSGMHVATSPAPLEPSRSVNEPTLHFNSPSPSLLCEAVLHPRAPPMQDA